MFRLYRGDNPVVASTQEAVATALTELLKVQGGWRLRFSATEVFLGDEPIVTVTAAAPGAEQVRNATDQLPFLFYRDGVRKITMVANPPRSEVETFVRILRSVTSGNDTQDDLVTLLWQANLAHIQIEAVPLEQTIYLSAHAGCGSSGGGDPRGQVFACSPGGSEIRSEMGQAIGPQGLHRDTFDDWALPDDAVEVPGAFALLEPGAEAARRGFLAAWEQEASTVWEAQAPGLLRGLAAMDGSEDMRRVLTRAITTWLTASLQNAAWGEAARAIELLDEMDPDRRLGGEELTAALATVDAGAIADRFDEGDPDDQGRFAALIVKVGPPAVGLCVDIMARAEKARARAATVTALCYLCADDPELLAPWLLDSRWHVVRNIVFVLGHIGGPAIVPLLHTVSRHPEPRVRRQLVQALGSLSPEERNPLLIDQLDTRDPQLLSAALNVLMRDRDARTVRAILACVNAPDFESREENNQRTLFSALGEIAGDEAVPALDALLNKGGWFARRTLQRVAAARTLRRIGTPNAMAALEAGVRSRTEAVRAAALEALGTRSCP